MSKSFQQIRSEFQLFRSAVPLKRAQLPHKTNEVWSYYQLGGEGGSDNASGAGGQPNYFNVRLDSDEYAQNQEPLIFIPGATTSAESFFYQLDGLSCKGYTVIACQPAPYYSVDDWVEGFDRFLDCLKTQKAHIFGVSLGGFLAQLYAAAHPRRVASLVLCNSFTSTATFAQSMGSWVPLVHVSPTAVLRSMLLENFPKSGDKSVLEANEWVKERLSSGESLDGYDLASRITLAYSLATVGNVELSHDKILIVDVNDQCVTTSFVRQELQSRYPGAKVATLKVGGDFPFLSCAEEMTLHIEVHLRKCGCFPLKQQTLAEQRVQQQQIEQERIYERQRESQYGNCGGSGAVGNSNNLSNYFNQGGNGGGGIISQVSNNPPQAQQQQAYDSFGNPVVLPPGQYDTVSQQYNYNIDSLYAAGGQGGQYYNSNNSLSNLNHHANNNMNQNLSLGLQYTQSNLNYDNINGPVTNINAANQIVNPNQNLNLNQITASVPDPGSGSVPMVNQFGQQPAANLMGLGPGVVVPQSPKRWSSQEVGLSGKPRVEHKNLFEDDD